MGLYSRKNSVSLKRLDGETIIQQDREHGRRDGAALGKLVELHKTQDLGRRHKHGPRSEEHTSELQSR